MLYGLDLPVAALLIPLWWAAAIRASRAADALRGMPATRAVDGTAQVVPAARGAVRLCGAALLASALFAFVVAAGLGWQVDPDKVALHLALSLLPAASVLLLSVPGLRRRGPRARVVIPLRVAAPAAVVNLYFLLVPHVPLHAVEVAGPLTALLAAAGLLTVRRHRRRRAASTATGACVAALLVAGMAVPLATTTLTTTPGASAEAVHKHALAPVPRAGRVVTEGAAIYYEVRGQGPPLLMISGGGGDAGFYGRVAPILAHDYQVITYDRRGNSRSGTATGFETGQQARDAEAVLRAAGHRSAYVFGNSGGAIIGLALAASRPGVVRTLVAHEPPTVRMLPDAEKWLSMFAALYRTSFVLGEEVAMARFALATGIPPRAYAAVPEDFSRRTAPNHPFFVRHEMLPFVNYLPDPRALRAARVRVIPAAGRTTLDKSRFYGRTATVLARELNTGLAVFPGHHLSFFDLPEEWAATLREVLRRA